jgi:hypothetical protein
MDLPKLKLPNVNIKDILQKLSVLTSNLSLLVAVIITVLSILLFIPTYLFSSGLKNQVQQISINQGLNKITELNKVFNSPEKWKFDENRLGSLRKDQEDINNLSKQTTQRQYLSKEVFSVDSNSSTFSSMIFTQFGRLYCSGIDSLLTAGKSGYSVTKEEIDSTIKSTISDSSRIGGPGMTQSNILLRRPSSGASVLSAYTSDLEWMVIDQLCQQKAKSLLCYIDPTTLGGYKELKNYEYKDIDKAEYDCWFYQLAYWVIEDVVKTIDKMNSKSENVLVAPVKRLMEISFNTGIQRREITNFSKTDYRDISARTAAAGNMPVYVVLPIDKLTEAYTLRYCNDMIDVIHFRVKFVISTQALFELMRELCSSKSHIFIDTSEKEQQLKHNQITVLETSLKPIDTSSAYHELYRYGQGNVSELDMVCEYVFVKKGYEDTKPEIVKMALSTKISQGNTTTR